jgi:predicted dehydrogenase
MTELKVGIAGFGVVGKKRKACVDRHPNLRLVAVCDRNFDDEGLLEEDVYYYQNYQRLLDQELDILIICLTNEIAPEVTIAGLQSGFHVFCEKPPGRTVEDIKSVIHIENQNPSLKLMYGFNHRYHESVQNALNLVQDGKFGKVINIRGLYGKAKLITFNQPDWRTKREIAGGGVLLDQGIHMVDLMRLFGGNFTEVHSFISNRHWGYDVEDNAYALMKTEDGVVGMLNSSATQWRHRFNLDINLEYGSIILGGIISGTKSYGAETLTVLEADPDNDNGDPKEKIIRYNRDPSWDEEIIVFVNTILNKTQVQSGSSKDALKTMQLVYKIYYSDIKWREKYDIKNPDI